MNLPERFDIEYVTEENTKARPVMIHRAILGSFERFIGILTEHYAGEFPFIIAPTNVIFVPIADAHVDYCKQLQSELLDLEIDTEIYDRNESLNKRIRTAEKRKVPMIVVVGDEEVANNQIALRDRRKREQSTLSREEFINLLKQIKSEGKV
jgi:threonyl-tRNA synthetase